MTEMLTIIIPTMNRSDFVARLLNYYAGQRFKHTLFVGDSSGPEHQRLIAASIEKLSPRLNVVFFDCQGLNNYEVMQSLLEKVKTPYASYLADDDFLVVPPLEECIDFMEQHPDYAGACGQALLFQLKQSGPYGDFDSTRSYPEFDFPQALSQDRLLAHLTCYSSSFHAVCRTATLKKALRHAGSLNNNSKPGDIRWRIAEFFGELATSCSLLIQGKLKVLDSLHYVRQTHDRRYNLPDWYDWLTHSCWNERYQIFRGQLIEELTWQGVSPEEGAQVFKRAFWTYLAHGFSAPRLTKYEKKFQQKNSWRDYVKKIPGAKKTWGKLRSMNDAMSLKALLKDSSPHHRAFMPIYSLITNQGGSR